MAEKVLITPRSYGKGNPSLFERLINAGFDPVLNETGGIMSKEQMMEAIAPCAGIILGVDPMDADVIAAAPNLRAIAKYGVGLDNIDLNAAGRRGIRVSKTVGANAEAVADYAMALMLALARQVIPIDKECRQGNWQKITTSDVSHKILGLFGLGAIGRHVARRAQGFSMKVLAYDVYWDEAYAQANGIEYAAPERIFREADFISLHLPLMEETRHFVGKAQLDQMKKSAILINTARGGIIDEDALLAALKDGRIASAGLDAFSTEPPENKEWFSLPNVVIGSHCAASTVGAAENMGTMATENLIRDMEDNR